MATAELEQQQTGDIEEEGAWSCPPALPGYAYDYEVRIVLQRCVGLRLRAGPHVQCRLAPAIDGGVAWL